MFLEFIEVVLEDQGLVEVETWDATEENMRMQIWIKETLWRIQDLIVVSLEDRLLVELEMTKMVL